MKHEELLKLIKENPELEMLPMVYTEVVGGDDYNCWMGSWGKCGIDEYWDGEERVYFRKRDEETLIEELIDINEDAWAAYADEEREQLAKEIVNRYDWKKCIYVYIDTP